MEKLGGLRPLVQISSHGQELVMEPEAVIRLVDLSILMSLGELLEKLHFLAGVHGRLGGQVQERVTPRNPSDDIWNNLIYLFSKPEAIAFFLTCPLAPSTISQRSRKAIKRKCCAVRCGLEYGDSNGANK